MARVRKGLALNMLAALILNTAAHAQVPRPITARAIGGPVRTGRATPGSAALLAIPSAIRRPPSPRVLYTYDRSTRLIKPLTTTPAVAGEARSAYIELETSWARIGDAVAANDVSGTSRKLGSVFEGWNSEGLALPMSLSPVGQNGSSQGTGGSSSDGAGGSDRGDSGGGRGNPIGAYGVFFDWTLPSLRRKAAVKLIEGASMKTTLPRLFTLAKSGEKLFPDGTRLDLSKTIPMRGKDKLSGIEGSGPFLTLESKDRLIVLSLNERGFRTWTYGSSSTDPERTMSYDWLSIFERNEDVAKQMAEDLGKQMAEDQKILAQFMWKGADFEALLQISHALDNAFNQGKRKDEIDADFSKEADLLNQATGEFARRFGLIRKYSEFVGLLKKGRPKSLGGGDVVVSLSNTFSRKKYIGNGNYVRETLAQNQGPLMVVIDTAGSVSHAVRLNALKEGRLEVIIAADGDPPFSFVMEKDGRVIAPAEACIYMSVMIVYSHLMGEKLEEISEEKKRRDSKK